MQNIVLFNVTHNEPITIKHNGVVVNSGKLDCVYGTNLITIEGIDYVVKDVLMFDMGDGEIVKHATNEKGVWTLKY